MEAALRDFAAEYIADLASVLRGRDDLARVVRATGTKSQGMHGPAGTRVLGRRRTWFTWQPTRICYAEGDPHGSAQYWSLEHTPELDGQVWALIGRLVCLRGLARWHALEWPEAVRRAAESDAPAGL